jgi:hypothetical protein
MFRALTHPKDIDFLFCDEILRRPWESIEIKRTVNQYVCQSVTQFQSKLSIEDSFETEMDEIGGLIKGIFGVMIAECPTKEYRRKYPPTKPLSLDHI